MIRFAGISFKGKSSRFLLNELDSHSIIITVNAEIINLVHNKPKVKDIVEKSVCTFDGQVPYVLARVKNYSNFDFDKVSGSEFIFDIAKHCKSYGKKLFILGGSEQSNCEAVRFLTDQYGIKVKGFSPPLGEYPFSQEINSTIKKEVANFSPDYVVICFSAEKSIYWAGDNHEFLKDLGVVFSTGLGGTVDQLSGKVKRAPTLIQKLGVEGLYRLIKEPKWFRVKRILVSLKIFWHMFRI